MTGASIWSTTCSRRAWGQVVVTDQQGAEQLAHFESQPRDILVSDCGYGYRKNVAFAHTKQADTVVRVYLPSFPLEDADGQPFDALAWLLAQHGTLAEWSGFCRERTRRYRVRLIASKLPPDKVEAARKRKAKKANKAHRKLTPTTLALAGWLVLITTLDATWPASEVLRLYQARWQIEIVFSQVTKADVGTRFRGWDHIANFDLIVGDDHTIDQ